MRDSRFLRALRAGTILAVLAAPAQATPANGTYTGTISSGGTVTIVVSGGQVTSFSLSSYTSGCGTISGSIGSCSTIGDNFTCGQTFCAPDGAPRLLIEGTFAGSNVSGTIDLSLQGPVITIPPPCCTRSNVAWSASSGGGGGGGGGAPPTPGEPILDDQFPDFRFWVRITGANTLLGTKVPECIEETVCVSGALPDRAEVFLRIVGPKPNGYLWPTLIKFTTSQVEVWIEQISSGMLQYYLLEGASPGFDELPGLFDRTGFLP
ncbi:MAG TPA: hypothetical protein VMT16_03135 [Thermoanaerobaculia bacterium]|nr:hypothetical protein [Thermoanaerobaculia bacterium]